MLVSWMGAELLASGNRIISRVFGKLSVLLGMYALTCLLIDVSNLTHGHAPFHRSAGQRNHAVRRGSVCDSTYRRIQERTMMVDYSDWLNSSPRNPSEILVVSGRCNRLRIRHVSGSSLAAETSPIA